MTYSPRPPHQICQMPRLASLLLLLSLYPMIMSIPQVSLHHPVHRPLWSLPARLHPLLSHYHHLHHHPSQTILPLQGRSSSVHHPPRSKDSALLLWGSRQGLGRRLRGRHDWVRHLLGRQEAGRLLWHRHHWVHHLLGQPVLLRRGRPH